MFKFSTWRYGYGIGSWNSVSSLRCVNDVSASDYGTCYNVDFGKAVFTVSDSFLQNNVPTLCSGGTCTLPCESSGTCIRYKTLSHPRVLNTIIDLSSVGKQVVLYRFRSLTHASANFASINYEYVRGVLTVSLGGDIIYSPITKNVMCCISGYEYDPVTNVLIKVNRYTIAGAKVFDVWWSGQLLNDILYSFVYEGYIDNIWYGGHIEVYYAYERSPILIMPLGYDDYLVYPELRSVVGYADNGVDQSGWNADDIIRVVQELFPDRPWLVYDDKTFTLYSNGLDIDDVLELGKYVDVVNEAVQLVVLNSNIPRKAVNDFINYYKQRAAAKDYTQ